LRVFFYFLADFLSCDKKFKKIVNLAGCKSSVFYFW
jgi:hypothetical protein